MSIERKATVVAAFVFRLFVAALFIGFLVNHLRYLSRFEEGSGSASLAIVPSLIWLETLLSYALLSTTIPCLKGFLGRFQTGDLARLNETTAEYGYGSQNGSRFGSKCQEHNFALRSLTKHSKSRGSGRIGNSMSPLKELRSAKVGHSAMAYGGRARGENASIQSDGSEQLIIHRHTEIDVTTE